MTYPILRAIHAERGPVDILHFDAHPDLYDDYQGNKRSHASPFARIMEEGLARRLVQVGIRTLERRQRAQVERFGVEIIPMRTFSAYSVPILQGPLYVVSISTGWIRLSLPVCHITSPAASRCGIC